jgi:hypothetical protein
MCFSSICFSRQSREFPLKTLQNRIHPPATGRDRRTIMLKRFFAPHYFLPLLCFLSLCLPLTTPCPASADTWTLLTATPTGNDLFDAYSPDGGTTSYIVGDGGLILKKTGSTYTPMASGTAAPLKAIHGRSATDIWAVGGSGCTSTTEDPIRSVLLHFDGSSWTATTPPKKWDWTQLYTINDVWTSPTGKAYAVSDMTYEPIKWNASASKWEFEDVVIGTGQHTDFRLTSIFGFADNDIYAIGYYGTIIHYDGTAWTIQAQYEPAGSWSSNLLQTVWGPSSSAIFAGGNTGQLYRLLPSDDSGWQLVFGGIYLGGANMMDMDGTGANDVWLIGAGGAIRHWTGVPNTLENHNDPTGKTRYTIWPAGSGQYYFAGSLGLIESFNPSTATRQALNTPPTLSAPWKTAVFSGRLWLAPIQIVGATGLYTWDGGRLTSHPVSLLASAGATKAFKAFSTTDMWLSYFDHSEATVVTLRGNGTTWTDWRFPNGSGASTGIRDVVKTPSGSYVVLETYGSTGRACFVTDFIPICLGDDAAAYKYNALAASPNGDVHAVGQGGKVALWRNGAWSETTVGTNGDELTAVAATTNMVVAVGVNNVAYYSTNGTTWQPVSGITREAAQTSSAPLKSFTAITHAGNGVFWASLNTGSGYTDGGKGFLYRIQNGAGTLVQGGFSSPLNGLGASIAQEAAFAVGDNGVLWTTNPNFKETIPGSPSSSLLLLLNN